VVGNHTWHWTVHHYSGMLWFHVIVYSLICTGIAFAAAACMLPPVSNLRTDRVEPDSSRRRLSPTPQTSSRQSQTSTPVREKFSPHQVLILHLSFS
jgi:hypothetical protein